MNILSQFHTLIPLLVLLTTIVVMAIFGLIVITRTYRKAYGWYFALTMLGIVAWVIGDMLLLFSRSAGTLHVGAELFYIGPMIIPIFIWFFALSFPEDHKIGWKAPLIAGLAFASYSAVFLTNMDFFVKGIDIVKDGLNAPKPQMPGYLLYAEFFSLFFICTYIAFMVKIRRLRGVSRTQVSYTFYGALVASVPALFTNLLLPMIGNPTIIWLGPLFTLAFAVSVTTAIVRHRLFDIRSYAIRSAAYLVTLLVVGAAYVVPAVFFTTHLLHAPLQARTMAFLVFITLFVAFLFHPLKQFFDKLTRTLFYQDAYDPQEFYNAFNQTLVENVEPDKLLQAATSEVVTTMKSEFCVVSLIQPNSKNMRTIGAAPQSLDRLHGIPHSERVLANMEDGLIVTDYLMPTNELKSQLTKSGIAVMARLVQGQVGELGYLVMGPKKSGNPYNNQDIKVIRTIAAELAIAIQNALRFEEIENFNETLQLRIDEATRKLRNSNEKLRRLDETKDDFISMASHQLRTPLTSVKGYVSMVLDGDAGSLTPAQRKLLTQSFVSAQRMVYLISDLLNVSRLRTGKFVIEPIPCNIAQVTGEEVKQLVETAKGRNLELIYHRPERFPSYLLDEMKLRQVIMNFIDNAIYYTPSGGTITVTVADKPQAIEFTVSDTGIGVPKSEQHHLFSKFYRADNAKTARPDGTGLGLFMAKKVIIAQEGAIIFHSQEGKGSTFGFTFAKSKLTPTEK